MVTVLLSVLLTLGLFVEKVFLLHCECTRGTQNDTGAIQFLKQYPAPSYKFEVNTYHCLCCCTNKPSAVTSWFKRDTTFKQWDLVKEDPGRQNLKDDCRCVEFIQIRLNESGIYRCIATDGLNNISTETNVSVNVCTSDKSFPVEFKLPSDTQATLGSDSRMVCEGDFSCLVHDSFIWWSVIGQDGHLVNLSSISFKRYTVGNPIRLETKLRLELTIHKVSEEDYNARFVCSLKKSQQETKLVFFRIVPSGSKSFVEKHLGLIVGLSVVALVLVTVGLLLSRLCGSLPVYWLKFYTNTLPQRGVDHKFDVLLIGDEETEKDIEKFQAMLRERNYTLLSMLDLDGGQQVTELLNTVEECVAVIFLVTDINLNHYSALIGACVHCKTHMIFVTTKSTVDWKKILEEYKSFSKTIPKLYTVVRWPSESRFLASLQWRVFWARVQSSLPKPRHLVAGDSQQLIGNQC